MADRTAYLQANNSSELQACFREFGEAAYYSGDLWAGENDFLELRSERKQVGAMSIIHQRSRGGLFFRRTRQHIRTDATDLSILWFVRYGELRFSNQNGVKVARLGDCAITRSTSPFFIECRVDDSGVHDVLHVALPTHLLRTHCPFDWSAGLFMESADREIAFAQNILTDIFEANDDLGDDSARLLANTAISLISSAMKRSQDGLPTRLALTERRVKELLRFIDLHLANPSLSPRMAATGCGISTRYLASLLHATGSTFSGLMWSKRLERSREILAASDPKEVSISELCYSLGFKSPCHFSRMFKRAHGVSPSEFRDSRKSVEARHDGGGEAPTARLLD